jgi:hypothetical protein
MLKKGWPNPATVMADSGPCRESLVQLKRGGLRASPGRKMRDRCIRKACAAHDLEKF